MKSNSDLKDRYIHFASVLIRNYRGDEPFHLYLKKYFRDNKKHGSRDRKIITSLCYNYFRLGMGVNQLMSFEKKIDTGNFIFEDTSTPLEQKLKILSGKFSTDNIFPLKKELSNEISVDDFEKSFLTQPLLFIRIRPGNQSKVLHALQNKEIPFRKFSDSCLGFSNNTQLEKVLDINKEVVIQDLSSQQVSLFFHYVSVDNKTTVKLWDACAASGGKSILVSDYIKNINLTVSDKRKSILQNLQKRFKEAGISKYKLFQLDLSVPVQNIKDSTFDFIIADVPCSGSGTWARTPEQLLFFQKEKIGEYTRLQQTIIKNCLPKLKKGGYLLYITCSVFKKENEDNVGFFCKKYPLSLIHQQYLKGYQNQADSMFGALLKNK